MTYPVFTFGMLTGVSSIMSCKSNSASLGALKLTPFPSIRSSKSKSKPNGPVEIGLGFGTVLLGNKKKDHFHKI
jgi:hypothetical protein